MIRLLLDQGVPRSTVGWLRDHGIAARHVADIGLDRASDVEILDAARERGELVVTLDADFHSLLAVSGASSPSVIRVRWEGLRGAELGALIERVLAQAGHPLEQGAMVTVSERNVRLRRLPVRRISDDTTHGPEG